MDKLQKKQDNVPAGTADVVHRKGFSGGTSSKLLEGEIPRYPKVKWYAKFEVPGKPVTKKHKHHWDTKEMAYAETVAWAYRQTYRANPSHDDELAMFIEWYRGKKKDGTKPKSKMDADNVRKTIQDALSGIAYEDDTQIAFPASHRIWCEHGEARVIIWLGIIED